MEVEVVGWWSWLACAPPAPPETAVHPALRAPEPAPIAWPSPGVRLRRLPAPPAASGLVLVDPGHGTGENQGAVSSFGELEAVHALAVSERLVDGLAPWRVVLARTDHRGPGYPSRIARAAELGARALVSVHADVRGAPELWAPRPGAGPFRRVLGSAGFAVLYSSQGELGPARLALARALARRLSEAGFPAYDGADYGDLYDVDEVPGVFRDRRGLAMLRRPAMPSVIVETHNALHPGEVARWREPETVAAFAAALSAGLGDALGAGTGYAARPEAAP